MAAAGTLAVGLWTQGAGAAEVKNVTAEYGWPWGAEIRYEVVGTIASDDPPVIITATDRANNMTYEAVASALSGDTGIKTGVHKVLWNLDKQGIKLLSTNVVFRVMYEPLYCVVDLSGGLNASSYPVTYMDEPPNGGFNTDAYKTTKLVLRRIPAGTFKMEGSYQVTLTKPFYTGLFEVTQKQWMLVMGSNPSKYTGDMRPVEMVSYNMIRGSSLGAKWPANNAVDTTSFLGKLRTKTGLEFDLPTEAQWEYACRAGTTSSFNNGGSADSDLAQMGRYGGNTDDGKGGYSQHTKVGSYKANAWGLYDMHGNVWEWCLDWHASPLNAGTDPKGSSSGSKRLIRGGSWWHSAGCCTSSFRGTGAPSDVGHEFYYRGFRLVRTLSN